MIKLLEKLKGWNPNNAWGLKPVPTDMSVKPYDPSTDPYNTGVWPYIPTWREAWADLMDNTAQYNWERDNDPINKAIAAKADLAAADYVERMKGNSNG